MPLVRNRFGGNSLGKTTITAGQLLNMLVPPSRNGKTFVTTIVYQPGATAHVLTYMRPIGKAYTTSPAASGATTLTLNQDPGAAGKFFANSIGTALASGHYVVIRYPDETLLLTTISGAPTAGANGSLSITLAGSLGQALPAGATLWQYGIYTSTDPRTGNAFFGQDIPATNLNTINNLSGGDVVGSEGVDEPLLIQSNNPTNAGTFEQVSYEYGLN